MISTSGITLSFGERVLFKDVSLKFMDGNCYGLIGANGAGKSTFLKILSGDIEPDFGDVIVPSGQRIAVLKQNQFEFEEFEVLETVLMGNKPLYEIMKEKDAIYAKPDFSDEDGTRVAELESAFAEMNGWDAESSAAEMLEQLGISVEMHRLKMSDLEAGIKVRVLLAQALFGQPDILLLDEPTNNLDVDAIMWLEEFLIECNACVIVVSHDRHFLDKVTTHIADIDFGEITLYSGNYSFWYMASQLKLKQRQDKNKKVEDKAKELKSFIERFSANASKSRQATSRKRQLEKLNIEEIKPSTRKYPHIRFTQEREAGKDLLFVEQLGGSEEGKPYYKGLDLTLIKGEKVAFVGKDTKVATHLFEVFMGLKEPESGTYSWGITTKREYFPKDHGEFFKKDINLIDWLRQYATSKDESDEEYLRGFLGKMLFSGQEVLKKANVLSGGEKVRCMLAKIMMQQPNVLILNEPTNHLDLESIQALNEGLQLYDGTVLLISQDRETIDQVANRIVEVTDKGLIDKEMKYSEYLEDPKVIELRKALY